MLSEFLIRFTVMISFILVIGGLGLIFIASFFRSTKLLRPIEYLGLSMAVGLAMIIFLVSLLTLLHVPLTPLNLTIALLGGCGVSLLRLLIQKPEIRIRRSLLPHQDLAENILPLGLFLALILIRLVQYRDVFVPNGYDGLIHTTLLQQSAETTSIFSYGIFRIGFPALSLVIYSLWKLTPAETILITGQWLSAVCGLSFYLFARRYVNNVYAAGLSFVIYAFLLFFPSALAAWGQYSFLLGMTLLPLASLASIDWITRKSSIWTSLLLALSLALTHLGSLLFWSSLIAVYAGYRIALRKPIRSEILSESREVFLRPLLLISPVVIVTVSRAIHSLQHYFLQSNSSSPGPEADLGFGLMYLFRLFRTHDAFFIVLGLSWILWSLVWKRRLLYVTLFWSLAIWFITWLQYEVLRFPIFTYQDLIIFLCLPLALCIGLLARQVVTLLKKMGSLDHRPLSRRQTMSRLSIILAVSTLVGLSHTPLSLDQKKIMFTNEDLLAMQWINANTAQDAGFLIRNTTHSTSALIPSDGGGWISLLTGRRTVIPQTGELYDICVFAEEHGVNYMYFGKQTGDEGFDLRLSDLEDTAYEVVYGSQAVEIAALRCP
jgi:hypothetical protein